MKHIYILLFFTAFATTLFSQEAKLDSSFGTNGYITTNIGPSKTYLKNLANIHRLLQQPDGKFIALGLSFIDTFDFNQVNLALVRYNADGSLDNTFGNSGKVIYTADTLYPTSEGVGAILQSDGKIIAAVNIVDHTTLKSDFSVLRFNTDGTIDNSFGTNGLTNFSFGSNNAIVGSSIIDESGKILVAGTLINTTTYSEQYALTRFTQNGRIDSSFGVNGAVVFSDTAGQELDDIFNTLAIQPGGKILAGGNLHGGYYGGNDIRIYRFNTNGSIDSSFAVNGRIVTGDGPSGTTTDFIVYPNGKFLALYTLDTVSVLSRYNADGSIDATFGTNGSTIISGNYFVLPFFYQMLLAPDSSIYLGGSLDAVEGGDFFALAHCSSSGRLDNFFASPYGIATSTNYFDGFSLIQQADGKIILGGENFEFGGGFTLARFLIDLTLGIADISNGATSLLVYPNPVTGPVTLQYQLPQDEKVTLQIFNEQGQLISTMLNNAQRPAGANKENIELPSQFAAGNYFLKVSTPQGNATIQLVKAK